MKPHAEMPQNGTPEVSSAAASGDGSTPKVSGWGGHDVMTPLPGGPSPGGRPSAYPSSTRRVGSSYQNPLILSQLQSARALVSRLQRKGTELLASSTSLLNKEPENRTNKSVADLLSHITPGKISPASQSKEAALIFESSAAVASSPAGNLHIAPVKLAAAVLSQVDAPKQSLTRVDTPEGATNKSAAAALALAVKPVKDIDAVATCSPPQQAQGSQDHGTPPKAKPLQGSELEGPSGPEAPHFAVPSIPPSPRASGGDILPDTPRKQQQYKMLVRERELSDAAAEELQTQLKTVALLQGRVSSLEAEKRGLQREIELQRAQAQGLEEDLAEANMARDQLQAELAAACSTAAEAQVEADRSAQVIYQLRSDLAAAEQRAADATTDMEAARAELAAQLSKAAEAAPSRSSSPQHAGGACSVLEAQRAADEDVVASSRAPEEGMQVSARGGAVATTAALLLSESRCAALQSELSATQGLLQSWLECVGGCCEEELAERLHHAGKGDSNARDGAAKGPSSQSFRAVQQLLHAVHMSSLLHTEAAPPKEGSLVRIREMQAEMEHILDSALVNKGGRFPQAPTSTLGPGTKPTSLPGQEAEWIANPMRLSQGGAAEAFAFEQAGKDVHSHQAQGRVSWDPAVGDAACKQTEMVNAMWLADTAATSSHMTPPPVRLDADPSTTTALVRGAVNPGQDASDVQWMGNSLYADAMPAGATHRDRARPDDSQVDSLAYSTDLAYRCYGDEARDKPDGILLWKNKAYTTTQDPFMELAGMWELPAAEPPPCFD